MYEVGKETKLAIQELIHLWMERLPYILGIDELIGGCEVIDMDPETAGAVLPRYIQVRVHEYYQNVMWRGGFSLSVGDYVTVMHIREGDRYEVMGAGGSSDYHCMQEHTHDSSAACEGGAIEGVVFGDDCTPDANAVPAYTDYTAPGTGHELGARGGNHLLSVNTDFVYAHGYRFWDNDAYIDLALPLHTLTWRAWNGVNFTNLLELYGGGQLRLMQADGKFDCDGATYGVTWDADGDTYTRANNDDEKETLVGGNLVETVKSDGVYVEEGDDFYPDGEPNTIGLFHRASGIEAWDDHCRAAPGWNWAGAPFVNGNSGLIDGSIWRIWHNVNGQRIFYYKATIAAFRNHVLDMRCCLYPSACMGGLRLDDGSDNNYVEWGFRVQVGNYNTEVVRNVTTGGVGPVTTILHTDIDPLMWYNMRIRCKDTAPPAGEWAAHYQIGVDYGLVYHASTSGLTWTVNRAGMFLYPYTNNNRFFYIDAYAEDIFA